MAIIWGSAAGLDSVAAGIEFPTVTGTLTIETSLVRSSGKAFRFGTGETKALQHNSYSAGQGVKFYRVYLHLVTAPTSTRAIVSIDNSSNLKIGIRLTNGRILQLFNEEDVAQIGSNSSAINTGEYYRIELKVDSTTLASTVVEARLYAASAEGTLLWNPSGTVNLAADPNRFTIANRNDASLVMVVTDMTINDDQGSFVNTWPGEGSLVYLRPASDAGTNDWARGGADSGSNAGQVDDVTTNFDATDYLEDNTADQIDEWNLTDTPAAVQSGDVINWVGTGARFAYSSTSGTDPDFVMRLKVSSSVDETGNLGGAGSTFYTTYQTGAMRFGTLTNDSNYQQPGGSSAWTKSALDSAVLGIRESVTDTHLVRVSAAWLIAEHKPAGDVTVNLAAATVASSGPQLDVQPGAVTKSLSAATIVAGGQGTLALPDILYRDEFDTDRAAGAVNGTSAEPGPGTRSIVDTGSDVTIEDGRLVTADGTGGYNDPSYWLSSYARNHVGALSGLVRLTGSSGGGSSDIGPMLILNPSDAPADPTATGLGWYFYYPNFRSPGLGTGNLNKVGARARSIDYLVTTIPRVDGGAFVVVSGGVYGTFPDATILWVYDSGTDTPIYAGWQNYLGKSHLDIFTVLGSLALPVSFKTRYGAATDYDTFARASLGSTEGQASAWTQDGGSWSITSGKLGATGAERRLLRATGTQSDGWWECDITTAPSGTIDTGLRFRVQDASNYLAAVVSATSFALRKYVDNAETNVYQTAISLSNNTTHRIRVLALGNKIWAWVDNVEITSGTAQTITEFATATGFGFTQWLSDNGSTFDNFVAWPETITLPDDLGPFPEIPSAVGSPTVTDSFTNTDGTDLSTHNAAWTQESGTWEIRNNKAQLTAANATGIAVRETSLVDQEVSASITTPNTTPTYPDDWYCGVVARYTDLDNFLIARFLYQNNFPEIELWERIGASSTLIGFVGLGTNNLTANTAYTLKLAIVDAECAVYLGTELVLQTTTALLTGTKAGIGVQSPLIGQPKWDDFSVAPTTVIVLLSSATISSSGPQLDVQPGDVSKTLAVAELIASGPQLDVQPGAVAKILAAAQILSSGPQLDVQPGAVTKNLSSAIISVAGQTVVIHQTTNLSIAIISASGPALDVQPGAVSKNLSAAVLASSGPAITISLGGNPVTINLSVANLLLSGPTLNVQPGAVSLGLAGAVITVSGQVITVTAPVGTSVNLLSAVISAIAPSISLIPGAVSRSLNAAGITVTGPVLDVVPGAVTRSLDTAGITLSAPALDVQPGAVSVVLTAGGINLIGPTLDVQTITSILLAAASIASSGPVLSVQPGAVSILFDAAVLTASGQTIEIPAEVIAIIFVTLANRTADWILENRSTNWITRSRPRDWTVDEK